MIKIKRKEDRHNKQKAAAYRGGQVGLVEAMTKIDQHRQLPAPCILCGKLTLTRGLFIPYRPEEWGALKGKGRIFSVSVCESHASRNCLTEIETRLMEEIAKDMGEHGRGHC